MSEDWINQPSIRLYFRMGEKYSAHTDSKRVALMMS